MDIAAEEIRAQVARMIRSKVFETSEVHRRLLQYLADKTINGEADRLKEYTIGLEAFGKPDSYDPRHDSIVRLQVGRLRQKLNSYYLSEATDQDVRISLPKGGFKLNFEVVRAEATGGAWHALPSPARQRVQTVALAFLAIWAIAATLLWVSARKRSSGPDFWTPELEALWAPLIESRRTLVLCLGAPLFVRVPEYGFFRDPRSNDWEDVK